MKKYKVYKDSGVEWIGEIPGHWDSLSFRFCIEILTDYTANGSFASLAKNVNYLEEGYSRLVRLTDLRVDFTNKGIYVDKEAHNFLGKSELYGGELLVANVGAYAGLVVLMPEKKGKYTLGPNMFLVRTSQNNLFFYYFLNSVGCYNELKLIAKSAAQPKLNKNNLRELKVILPPLQEQQKIATYLNHKTQQIDQLLALKEQKIALLQEKRTALINQAVTKGLDSSVKMKDSGVEWIGEIPEGWEVKKVSYLCSSMISGPFGSSLKKEFYTKKGYKIYGQEQVIKDDFNYGDYYVSEEKFKELQRCRIQANDILISCVGTFGKIAIVPQKFEEGIINPRLLKVTPKDEIYPRYLFQLLRSELSFSQFKLLSRGGTMGVINLDILRQLVFPISPNREEQKQIVNFIEENKRKIANSISIEQQKIALLKEYRQALISNAVTGKIRVCDQDLSTSSNPSTYEKTYRN